MLKAEYRDLSSLVYGTYGSRVAHSLSSFPSSSSHSSLWWRNIMKSSRNSSLDPIVEGCSFVVKNGYSIPFWESKWWGGIILKDVFPDLDEASRLKGVSLALMGRWENG